MPTPEFHPLTERIEAALSSIRPYLQADGGNVRVVEVTPDNVVRLALEGSCVGCEMAAMTFRGGIEEAIRRNVPEVTGIEAINGFRAHLPSAEQV